MGRSSPEKDGKNNGSNNYYKLFRMDLISEEEERGRGRDPSDKDGKKKKRHSRSKSAHKCKRLVISAGLETSQYPLEYNSGMKGTLGYLFY